MERIKAFQTWWDTNQQALRVFFYMTLPLIGVEAQRADAWWSWIVSAVTVAALIANLAWTLKWNKTAVITTGALEQMVTDPKVGPMITNAAVTIIAAKDAGLNKAA